MSEVKVTERGWAGHFICADKCLFRRNTLLEYQGKKWVVSTVGCMRTWNRTTNKYEIETIGADRFYETMAFVGENKNGYIDADVSQQIYFNSNWGIFGRTWDEVKASYDLPDNAANEMHDNVVKELSQKIQEVI